MTKQCAVTTENYFGGCSECGRNNGYLNIGRAHWLVCDEHKTKWLVGSNLFSSWREDDETIWQQNWEHMQFYREVKPVLPDYPDNEKTHAVGVLTEEEEVPF